MHQTQGHPPTLKKKAVMALRGYIDTNTLTVGDLNIPLPGIDRSYREKIDREILLLLHTLAQIDMTDKVFH
jgi:hypothetical protein